jgi:hypothetical protein
MSLAEAGLMKQRTRLLFSAALAASLGACNQSHSAGPSGAGGNSVGGNGVGGSGVGGDGMGSNGVGGSGASASLCGDHGEDFPRLASSTVGSGDRSYDGPAIVERSTPSELVLAFGGNATAPPLHTSISGGGPLPVLPVGAMTWLDKSMAGDPPAPIDQLSVALPVSFTVRDAKDGHILLGAAIRASSTAPAPIPFANVRSTCSGSIDTFCLTATATYSSVDVQGDTAVTIADNETGTVRVGGADYDVTVKARQYSNVLVTCANPQSGVSMEVRAKAPASSIAALQVGPPIACGRGNDEVKTVQYMLLGDFASLVHDGPVFYVKRDGQCYQFAYGKGEGPVLAFCSDQALGSEPQVDQEMWATVEPAAGFAVGALRASMNGPLLLGTVTGGPTSMSGTSAAVSQALGVPVEFRASCMYAANAPLWEASLGTTAPTVVKSDTHAVVTIDGKSYDAWMKGVGQAVSLSLVAQ